jgi:hypothetical protein
VEDQGHTASPEPPAEGTRSPEDPASGQGTPITGPDGAAPAASTGDAAPAASTGDAVPATSTGDAVPATSTGDAVPVVGSGRDRRADGLREALTSRGAGWAVAAAMTGAVVGLSVAMATSATPAAAVRPEFPAGLRGVPADAARAPGGGGVARALAPVRLHVPALQVPALQTPARLQVPARLRLQIPAAVPLQIPAAVPLQVPARLRIQVPAGVPLQIPARLRIQLPARPPAQSPAWPVAQSPARLRAVTPAARIQAVPGAGPPAAVPRALHLRVRPAQVRVRLRIPASARSQALPGPVRAVVPGPRAAAVLPASSGTPARLRIVFRKGEPIPARLLLPANLPGRARLRIQIPARARLTPALPAPPAW